MFKKKEKNLNCKRSIEDIFRNLSEDEVFAIKEDLKLAEEKIYNSFGQFLTDYNNNKINYLKLSSTQLTILNETILNICLPVEQGQLFEVKKLTDTEIYIMFYYYKGLNSNLNSEDDKLTSGITKTYTWKDFPNINFNPLNINVNNAVLNLSDSTEMSYRIKDKSIREEYLKPLVERIDSQIKDFFGKQNDSVECANLELLYTTKEAI